MNHPRLTILWRVIGRKLAIMLLLAVSAVASFATLGEGNKKTGRSAASLLSSKTTKPGNFSLKSGYTYRGNQVLTSPATKKYISLNTTITYQKGNTTYIVPLKKVALSNVKVEIGNQSLRRN